MAEGATVSIVHDNQRYVVALRFVERRVVEQGTQRAFPVHGFIGGAKDGV